VREALSESVRQRKRYNAAKRRHGLCRVCVHGESTAGAWHCRNAPGKHHGACREHPGSYPQFKVVENVLNQFADEARGQDGR